MRTYIYLFTLLVSLHAWADDQRPSHERVERQKKEDPKEEELKVNMALPVTYVVGIVRRGDNWQQDSLKAFELQEAHLAFLEILRKNNKLLASGPLKSSPDARGLYVFKVNSIEEAEMLVQQDKAVQAGWIAMEFHLWDARNYEEPVMPDERVKLKINTGAVLIGVFSLSIIILMLRTFRNKASA